MKTSSLICKGLTASVLLSLGLVSCQQFPSEQPQTPPTTTFEEVALALSVSGNELVTVGGANSGARVAVAGLNADTTLLSLDWRPSDGLIHALGSDGQLYTLTLDGALTGVGTPGDYGDLSEGVAFDFNPQLDALRVIATANGRNFVTQPDTGEVAEYTPSTYESGAPANPKVLATAYNNPVSPFPENAVTNQYSLEAVGNTYALQAKNDGTLTSIETLEVDIEGFAGLDISATTGNAYALLNIGGSQRLYQIGASEAALTELEVDVSGLSDLTVVPQ